MPDDKKNILDAGMVGEQPGSGKADPVKADQPV